MDENQGLGLRAYRSCITITMWRWQVLGWRVPIPNRAPFLWFYNFTLVL